MSPTPSKSLQQLENDDWGAPLKNATRLIERCHELRRIPLQDLTAEDCRLLLSQKIGAPYIVPIAIGFLQENPMEGGMMNPGVLLKNVLNQGQEFWEKHPELWFQLNEIIIEVEFILEGIEDMRKEMLEFGHLQDSIITISQPSKKPTQPPQT